MIKSRIRDRKVALHGGGGRPEFSPAQGLTGAPESTRRVGTASGDQVPSIWVVWGGGEGLEDGVARRGGRAAMAARFLGFSGDGNDGRWSGVVEGEEDEVEELLGQGIGEW